MKIQSIILTIVATIILSACSNELVTDAGDQEGYLILSLANSVTRTSGDDTDPGTTAESTINSLTVVFTDEAGIVAYTATPSINSGVTEKFKIALGDYYVYALINSNVTISKNQNINQVITVAAAKDATSGYKDGSFLMTNQSNSSSENAGIHTQITANNSLANPAKVTIKVDRVACKIVDETTNPNIADLEYATNNLIDGVTIKGYTILNVNREFNLIQQWGTDNAGGITLDSEVLSTPLYSNGPKVKHADQYFHNIGEYTTLDKINGEIVGIIDETIGTNDLFTKTPIYTTENRPTIMELGTTGMTAGRGEATGVIYKVQARYEGIDKETFYAYNGIAYNTIGELQALPAFEGKILPSSDNPKLRALGIKVYENGVMYYTYFIRDPNIAHQYEGKNYYGVFRNSTYKLKINSISSLGDDVPGGGAVDPTEPGELGNPPIDADEAHIEITLTVNPWIINVLGIDF